MKKKLIFVGIGVVLVAALVVFFTSIPKWSENSFEAVVQETCLLYTSYSVKFTARSTE